MVSSAVAALLVVGVFYSVHALRQERFARLSRSAFVQGDWKQTMNYAQAASTRWKSLDPFAVPVSYLEGMGHLMLARHREALACFQQARAEMPSRAYIVRSFALAHGMVGNYEESVACHAEVLRRSPRNAAVLNSLASVLPAAGNPQGALDVLARIPRNEWPAAALTTAAQAEKKLSGRP